MIFYVEEEAGKNVGEGEGWGPQDCLLSCDGRDGGFHGVALFWRSFFPP